MDEETPEEEDEEGTVGEAVQAKLAGEGQLQQQAQEPDDEKEEDEQIQPKRLSRKSPSETAVLQSQIQSLKGAGRPLPKSERAFFEPRFGMDFNHVRIHNNSRAAEVAQLINARAFTVGRDVVFGAGQYSPGTLGGKRLLAHELTHVVQQTRQPELQRRASYPCYRNSKQAEPEVSGKRLPVNQLLTRHSGTNNIPQVQRATHASVKKFRRVLREKLLPSYVAKYLLPHGQYSLTMALKEKLVGEFGNAVSKLQLLPSTRKSIIGMFEKMANKIYDNYGAYDNEVMGYKFAIDQLIKLSNASSEVKRGIRKMLKLPKASAKYPPTNLALKNKGLIRYERFFKNKEGRSKVFPHLKKPWYKAWKRLTSKQEAFEKGDLSLQNLMKIMVYEGQLCDGIARLTGSLTQSGRRSIGTDPLTRFKPQRLRYTKSTVHGSGEVLIYSGENLKYWVKRMKRALDKGNYIRARVSSGVKLDNKYGDHTLLIIGYQGNRFIFWNPAPAENPTHVYPGLKYQSIGYLFYTSSPPRLSTATDDSDMKVDIHGYHKTGVPGRKRYQVIIINTI